MQPIDYFTSRKILYLVVLASQVLMAVGWAISPLSIDPVKLAEAHYCIVFPLIALLLAYRIDAKGMYAALETLIACLAAIVPVVVWTYVAMSFGLPLADDRLAAMDAAIGFDWHGLIGFVDERPALAAALTIAYSSFALQILLLPMWLGLSGKGTRACAMVFGYLLLCFLSAVISVWFPALGTYITYGVSQNDLSSINAQFGFEFLDHFRAVREQADFVLEIGEARGIITFPSVHAGMAGLCAWAAWDCRILRFPLLVLNVMMAVSAVTHANHYLVDVIAGLGIAGLTACVATSVFYRAVPGRSVIAPPVASALEEPAGNVAAFNPSPAAASG